MIGLPANIFYGTSIPTCILVFKKCRETPEDILFIDASQYYEKVKTQNVLREEDIDRIVTTYRERTIIPKYSARIPIHPNVETPKLGVSNGNQTHPNIETPNLGVSTSIAENDYNLNIPRYVDTFEAEDSIDINALAAEIVELDKLMTETDKTITGFCEELNISTPF